MGLTFKFNGGSILNPLVAPTGTVGAPGIALSSGGGLFGVGTNQVGISIGGTQIAEFNPFGGGPGGLYMVSTGIFGWGSTTGNLSSIDVKLARDAANVLAQRNGTSAQQFNIYNTFTDASNYERFEFTATATKCQIQSQKAGTGVARTLELGTKGSAAIDFFTNNVNNWEITSSGHFIAVTDNTFDIGASGANRPRSMYLGTNLTVGGQILVPTNNTVAQIKANAADLRGISFRADNSEFTQIHDNNGVVVAQFQASGIVAPGLAYQWSAGAASPSDLKLFRDAANILAQRNGTNAQEFRLYNTFTDTSNYARLVMRYTSNIAYLVVEQAGTGPASDFTIGKDGGGDLNFRTSGGNKWSIGSSGDWKSQGNYNVYNGTSALPTTATGGFLGVNSCAGPPTGVPASIPTGQIPLVYDSTNDKLYIYRSGWKTIAAVVYS